MNLKKLSLTQKLILSIVPMVGAMCLVSLSIYRNSTEKDEEFLRAMQMVEYVNSQELEMVKMSEALRGYLLDPSNTKEFERKKAADEAYGTYAEKLAAILTDAPETLELNQKMAEYDEGELDRIENEVAELIEKRDAGALVYYNQKYIPARKIQSENFFRLKDLVKAKSIAILSAYDENRVRTALQEIGILLSSLVFGVACIVWTVTTNLRRAHALFDRVYGVSDGVDQSAGRMADSSTELSQSVNEQAAAIQETAASLDEVTAMIKKNSDNAAQSKSLSQESRIVVGDGKRSVEQVNRAMGEISESNDSIMRQVEAGNNEISRIIRMIGEIEDKTKVINDIVFQTKLLSFNASVEAARAGEHGKGFAVVAEEVGKLASMSGTAAKEISDKLQESSRDVESIISRTKGSVEVLIQQGKLKVDQGAEVSRQCGVLLDQITSRVEQVDQMVTEIALASDEQSKGITEINRAISQLDQVTQRNNQVAQMSNSQAEGLSAEAKNLRTLVDELYGVFNGERGGAGSVASVISLDRERFKASSPSRKAA